MPSCSGHWVYRLNAQRLNCLVHVMLHTRTSQATPQMEHEVVEPQPNYVLYKKV